jgi:hypothetical protein
MDIVTKKFEGFKDFLIPHIEDTTHRMALHSAPVELFLKSLAQYKGMSPEDITHKICASFNVDCSKYKKQDIERFHRYLAYFLEVVEVAEI